MPDVDPWIRRRTRLYEFGAYLLIVAVGVFGFARLENTQEDIEAVQAQDAVSIECTEDFFAQAAKVLEIRTGLTSKAQQADKAQNVAWANYVAYSIDNAGSDADDLDTQLRLVRKYFAKLQAYLAAVNKIENNRTTINYPRAIAYRHCLAGEEAPPK